MRRLGARDTRPPAGADACPVGAGRIRRLGAVAGLVGPAGFTAAWLLAAPRQQAYSHRDEHLSGLAAHNAVDPPIMIAGFLSAGTGMLGLAGALACRFGGWRHSGGGPGITALAGVAALAAGVLRRDDVLLDPPGRDPDYVQSWHNDGHDMAAGVIYASCVAAPLLLARRWRSDAGWAAAAPWAVALAAAEAAGMAVFATDVDRRGNGLLQRAVVSLPMLGAAAVSVRLLSGR